MTAVRRASASEPSDAIRVVNALLTQLDQIKAGIFVTYPFLPQPHPNADKPITGHLLLASFETATPRSVDLVFENEQHKMLLKKN